MSLCGVFLGIFFIRKVGVEVGVMVGGFRGFLDLGCFFRNIIR